MTNSRSELTLQITGMTCAACVTRIEKVLTRVEGVDSVDVNLLLGTAVVNYESRPDIVQRLLAAVEKSGYQGQLQEELQQNQTDSESEKLALDTKREGLSCLAALVLSLPLVVPMMAGVFFDVPMLPGYWQLVLTIPIQFGFGYRFYRGALKALLTRTATMDVLVALGTTAAFFLSLYLLVFYKEAHTGEPHLYFESSAVIITLILFGRYLEKRAKSHTMSAIRALRKLRPEKARILAGGEEKFIPVSHLRLGMQVVVLAGESIPVDGDIVAGETTVDESMITGESMPRPKNVGERVTGGAINGEGRIILEVTALESDSTLAKIIKLVESAQGKKAPIQKLVDHVSAVFVPIVLFIALMTFLAYSYGYHEVEKGLIHAISVLVIACPCALGLATPTALIVGMGRAAQKGILIRDSEALERAQHVKTVIFDKTGTLTVGAPEVKSLALYDGTQLFVAEEKGSRPFLSEAGKAKDNVQFGSFLQDILSVQLGSEHPLAKATVIFLKNLGVISHPLDKISAVPGKGVEASRGELTLVVGTETYLRGFGFDFEIFRSFCDTRQAFGETLSYFGMVGQKQPYAVLSFADKVKASAASSILHLKKMGIRTVMLTGDSHVVAQKLASELGVDAFYAGQLPHDKSEKILQEKEKASGLVAMVGDGINDAPALALADVGIAMGSGSDIAIKSAGVTLMHSDPMRVVDAIDIAQRTQNKIKQNLFWAFIYNFIGIPLAATGMLSPMVAAAAMALSSFSVVMNSLTLKKWNAT